MSLTGIENIGTWATEIEIITTAMFLNVNIYVYTQNNNKFDWYLFGKSGSFKNGVTKKDQCLYIEHVNQNHFQVIKSVL
jgi:hypothetical protein